jgi:hypothetical protein
MLEENACEGVQDDGRSCLGQAGCIDRRRLLVAPSMIFVGRSNDFKEGSGTEGTHGQWYRMKRRSIRGPNKAFKEKA